MILFYLKTVGEYSLLAGLNSPLQMQYCSFTIEWCGYLAVCLLTDRQLVKTQRCGRGHVNNKGPKSNTMVPKDWFTSRWRNLAIEFS